MLNCKVSSTIIGYSYVILGKRQDMNDYLKTVELDRKNTMITDY